MAVGTMGTRVMKGTRVMRGTRVMKGTRAMKETRAMRVFMGGEGDQTDAVLMNTLGVPPSCRKGML